MQWEPGSFHKRNDHMKSCAPPPRNVRDPLRLAARWTAGTAILHLRLSALNTERDAHLRRHRPVPLSFRGGFGGGRARCLFQSGFSCFASVAFATLRAGGAEPMKPSTPANPAVSWWQPVLFAAMVSGLGWGIRGQYGHETGAMISRSLLVTSPWSSCCVPGYPQFRRFGLRPWAQSPWASAARKPTG